MKSLPLRLIKSAGLNILFLANRIPYPPYRGDKLKIFNLARRMAERHHLYLITFVEDESDFAYEGELKKIFKEVHLVSLPKWQSVFNCALGVFSSVPFQVLYFRSGVMQRTLGTFLAGHPELDIIHTQHLRMSQYTAHMWNIPRILDLPDAFSLYWQRRTKLKANFFVKLFNRWEYRKVVEYEKIIKRFELNLVCSHEDKKFLEQAHKVNNVDILPNGVDQDAFAFRNHDYGIENRILFTGNMDYAPNIDAVCYFVEEVFPLIKQAVPAARFYIVGQRPVPKVTDLAGEDVIITGFVPELAEEYNQSTVSVSPIRIGAGTLNKVLEAMSMGVPVVCTSVGYEGLGISSGEGAVLATDTESFARETIRLLQDAEWRRAVGSKGVEVITRSFTWETITLKLEGYMQNVVNEYEEKPDYVE